MRFGRCTALVSLLVVAALAGLAGAASASRATTPIPEHLDRALEQFLRQHPTYPGVMLAVAAPKVSWSGAAGVADRASRKPLSPTAGFRIASVTKTFTAAAVLRLVEDGRVGLGDPIAKYLKPSMVAILREGGYDVAAMRVSHLLRHTSGLYDYAEDPDFQAAVFANGRRHWTRAEQVRFAMTHGKPYGPPGKQFHYSDTGYVLLGELLENVTGRSLAAAYRGLLGFQRLGLDGTYLETIEPRPAKAKPRAHQYYGTIDSTGFEPSFDLYGGGGLVSSVDDLARFYRALFTGRVFKTRATLRTMLGKRDPTRLDDVSMGIFSEEIGKTTCWGHAGFWGIFVTHCPAVGVTMALNVGQAQNFESAALQLPGIVLPLVTRS